MVSKSSQFAAPDTSALTQAAFLVGTPIAHSGSPSMHRAIYDSIDQSTWAQVLCETPDLASFMSYLRSEPKAMGSGVTMPFKVAVIPLVDQLTVEAQEIGAVNTIFFRKGADGQRIVCGTNTDCIGIRDAFLTNVPKSAVESYRGKPGLIVGGGGTCRAAVYALQRSMGCSTVYIINRDKSEVDTVIAECRALGTGDNLIHVQTVEQAQSLTPPVAIVSAVPDFTPKTSTEKTVREILQHFLTAATTKGAIVEMCYHPSPNTQISRLASQAGWQVIGGIQAMIGQGLAQASLWTGLEITDKMRAIAAKAALTKVAATAAAAAAAAQVSSPKSSPPLPLSSETTKQPHVVTIDETKPVSVTV